MTGADKHEPLLGAASSISDGDAVDWTELERHIADESNTAVVAELQVLDGIAQVHRTQWGVDPERIVQDARRLNPADRYRTVGTTEAALRARLSSGGFPSRRPRQWTILLLAAIIALAATIAAFMELPGFT